MDVRSSWKSPKKVGNGLGYVVLTHTPSQSGGSAMLSWRPVAHQYRSILDVAQLLDVVVENPSVAAFEPFAASARREIGRAPCRARGCPYGESRGAHGLLKKK